MKERGPSISSLFLGKTQPNQVRPFAAALRREGLVGVAVFFRGLLKIENKTKQNKKLKSRLRSGKGDPGSLPPPCLPWPRRGTSIASEASQTLYRRLQFSRGESEGGKPTVGGPLGPKKSLARGHAALARQQQKKRLLGCGLRIRSATLGPPHSASLTPPPPPPRVDQADFLSCAFFLSSSSSSFFFLFRFLPAKPGILCQEDSALSLLRPCPPLGCAPSQFR